MNALLPELKKASKPDGSVSMPPTTVLATATSPIKGGSATARSQKGPNSCQTSARVVAATVMVSGGGVTAGWGSATGGGQPSDRGKSQASERGRRAQGSEGSCGDVSTSVNSTSPTIVQSVSPPRREEGLSASGIARARIHAHLAAIGRVPEPEPPQTRVFVAAISAAQILPWQPKMPAATAYELGPTKSSKGPPGTRDDISDTIQDKPSATLAAVGKGPVETASNGARKGHLSSPPHRVLHAAEDLVAAAPALQEAEAGSGDVGRRGNHSHSSPPPRLNLSSPKLVSSETSTFVVSATPQEPAHHASTSSLGGPRLGIEGPPVGPSSAAIRGGIQGRSRTPSSRAVPRPAVSASRGPPVVGLGVGRGPPVVGLGAGRGPPVIGLNVGTSAASMMAVARDGVMVAAPVATPMTATPPEAILQPALSPGALVQGLEMAAEQATTTAIAKPMARFRPTVDNTAATAVSPNPVGTPRLDTHASSPANRGSCPSTSSHAVRPRALSPVHERPGSPPIQLHASDPGCRLPGEQNWSASPPLARAATTAGSSPPKPPLPLNPAARVPQIPSAPTAPSTSPALPAPLTPAARRASASSVSSEPPAPPARRPSSPVADEDEDLRPLAAQVRRWPLTYKHSGPGLQGTSVSPPRLGGVADGLQMKVAAHQPFDPRSLLGINTQEV